MPNLFIRQVAAYLLLAICLMGAFTAHADKPKHPKPDCKACILNGPTTGYVGQAGMFVLTTGTTAGWTVSNGATIIRSTSNTVTVLFNKTGNTNIETAGATCGGASINVMVTVAPLESGGIASSSGAINYGATPGIISASPATGGSCGSYSYSWYYSTDDVNWNLISGATGLSYQPGALYQTTYYKQVVSCGGTATSNIVTITVYSQLNGGNISPSNQTINYNATPSVLTLSGVSGGNGSYTYQWQSSSNSAFTSPTNVGSGGTTYSPGPLSSSTYYRVVVTSNGVTTYSTLALINVYGPLAGGGISPTPQTINYNTAPSTLTLSGVSGGSGTYTYQWQSSPNNSFSSPTNVGSGGTTYNPGVLTSTTYYRVVITSNGVTTYSTTAVVNVNGQLIGGSISPTPQTINYNTTPATLILSGVSGGSGSYTYQWQNSPNNSFSSPTNVGSGGTTYSPGVLTSTTYYRVVITSNGVTTYSTTAVVNVNGQLIGGSISPTPQTINYNTTPATLTLSGVSGGSGSYTYQWQSSPDNSFSSPTNVGSGGITYSPGVLTSTTYYRVAVTSNGVNTYSGTAVINVYSPLVGGSISPGTQTINYNTTPSTLILSGVSGGSGTYTYQWQSSPDNSFSSPTNIVTGGTTYSPGALTSTTYYRVVITSNGGTAYSSTAAVNVYSQLIGGSISPTPQTINYNTTPSPLTLTGVSGGSGSYTYQWQSSPNNSFSSPTNVVTGGTTYSPGALTSTTYYRVVITSNGGTAYSSTAAVNVYSQLIGGSISPTPQTINYNTTPSPLTLTGVSGGSGSYTYQWQSSPNNSFSSPTNVGTGGTTYSPGALTSTTYYRVVITSNGVTTYSGIAVVNLPLVGGIISPSPQTINYNTTPSPLTLSGVSGGSGSYTYQWMSSPDNSTWTAISRQTGVSYSPPSLTSTTYYEVVVTSNGISVNSASATVTVYPQLQAGYIDPGFQGILFNTAPSPLTLSGVSGGNGTYFYQWQWSTDFNTWMNLYGQIGTSYSPPPLTQSTLFQVTVTSNGVTAISYFAYIYVIPQLQGGSVSPATQTINYNTLPAPIVVNNDASGGDGYYYSYQWQSSPDNNTWTDISGQTIEIYYPPALTATTYYRVAVSDYDGSSGYSTSAVVNVYPPLQPGSLSPATQTITSGSPATISLLGTSGGSGTYTYQWQSSYDNSSWTNINGQTGTTYSPPPVSLNVYYRVLVASNGVTAYTDSINVMVNEPLNGGTVTGPGGVIGYNTLPGTLGSSQDAYGGSCYPGDYRYQWQYSTDGINFYNLAGVTSSSYTPITPLTASLYFRRQVSCSANTANSNTIYVQVTPQVQQNCSVPH